MDGYNVDTKGRGCKRKVITNITGRGRETEFKEKEMELFFLYLFMSLPGPADKIRSKHYCY